MGTETKVTINEDLKRERAGCSFDPVELTNLLDGGAELTKGRRERERFFFDDAELRDRVPNEFLSHREKYEEAVRKSCLLFRKLKAMEDESSAGVEHYQEIIGGQIGSAILKDGNPLGLHYAMFLPTIMGQGSIEQQVEWVEKAWNCEVIGTYAQTELGHGTFVRGLETTATYDRKTREFVLNSPTLTSLKWWPGGLGHTVNHAIVVAQLYIDDKCYGIHTFVVQLRDLETHRPLPGIRIGEIGHKLGMNATNNGFLGFENVRVPRERMLMKHSQVQPDGTYVRRPQSDKLTYGTMMFVRVALVKEAGYYLRKALTIAIRYSAVRRQCNPDAASQEMQILDYLTQQAKLFPLVANAFAFWYSATFVWETYNETAYDAADSADQSHVTYLGELHAIVCCLKAISTADAAAGVEIARLSCGGHGYMTASNLPTSYGLITAMCTYEGENTVLLLQAARFLVKNWKMKLDGEQLSPITSYLRKTFRPEKNLTANLVNLVEKVTIEKIRLAYDRLQSRIRKGMSSDTAWNRTSLDLVAAAEAHGRLFILRTYHTKTVELRSAASISEPLMRTLEQLCDLYVVWTAMKMSGELQRFCAVVPADIFEWQKHFESLLAALRPNIVGVVDGFDIADEILASALGAYDGNVYQRLLNEALRSPLNQQPVNDSFEKFLKPVMRSHL